MCQPGRRAQIEASVARAKQSLEADWDVAATSRALAANIPRYLARDYPIDGADDAHVLSRFDVTGTCHLDDALAAGRGVIVVGSHLGAHVAGLHWLYRRGVPLRLLVQRPGHVSRALKLRFDGPGPHPQPRLFLRRGLATGDAAERLLRAHAALRDGYAVYLNGDIPWPGPNARPGHFLGRDRALLAIWADLAVLARARRCSSPARTSRTVAIRWTSRRRSTSALATSPRRSPRTSPASSRRSARTLPTPWPISPGPASAPGRRRCPANGPGRARVSSRRAMPDNLPIAGATARRPGG